VKFEYDPAKDAKNLKDHGISLAEAEKLNFDSMIAAPDADLAYGEERMVGFAYMRDTADLYCIVFVERDKFRPISLRRATKAETKRFYESKN
jgi:uncharacterized DUF497 family protein